MWFRILYKIINLYDLYQLQCNEKVAKYNTIGIPDDVNFTQNLIENAINETGNIFFTYEQLVDILDKREVELHDHHDTSTQPSR